MSNMLRIFKQEKDTNTIQYTLCLSTTLSIQAQISRQQDKQGKTLYSLQSTILEGLHNPQGKEITRTQLGTDLGLFYSNPQIRNFHNAMPFLCSLIEGNSKSDSQPPTRPNLVERFKQRLTNLRLLRLEPQPQPTF